MHEMIEGLHGCEVIADDFLVVGYGENIEMGIQDHEIFEHSLIAVNREIYI